ncbi:phosphoglycerate dehydrogenase-like enzyme [Saccharothrix variisporea]|uniref:Phosphoglycerate dehydrogenase-like enzyme n=1 Tax=Saccharothrix variisporea TaxID=543527 RepID=A0A495XIS1_9PSEU|nr:phosphoglycerate dehydrogenase-like enzyme [Saccharothrix variisporea]
MVSWDRPEVLVAHSKMWPELVPRIAAEIPVRQSDTIAALDPETRASIDVLVGYQFPPDCLPLLPNLRWLHLTGTGTDHLAAAGLRPGTLVTNAARVPVEAVAEYAVAGLFMLLKDLVELTEISHRPAWYTGRAVMLDGATVLVLGGGRIGRAVIRRLSALGARCVAVTRTGRTPVPLAVKTVGVEALPGIAAEVDHVVACLPATDQPLVDKAVLGALPAHAAFVNVGRASTVDEEALYEALRSQQIRGAFLDVHKNEPLPDDDPVWQVPNLVVSPHRAFAFPGEPAEVARTFLDNLADLRAGRTPRDAVTLREDS